MGGIKRRLEKLERAMGMGERLIIIFRHDEDLLTSEEKAILKTYEERMIMEAKAGGLAIISLSRKKAQELLGLSEKGGKLDKAENI